MSEQGQRGPNYDWKHEAEHYRHECDKLRELLFKVEAQGERDAYERDSLLAKLEETKKELSCQKDYAENLQAQWNERLDCDFERKYECSFAKTERLEAEVLRLRAESARLTEAIENSLHDPRCEMVKNLRNKCNCHKNVLKQTTFSKD